MFLLVTAQVENDYKVTSICDVTKGKLKELDSVWMQSWGRVYDPDNYIFGDYEPVDPDALYLSEHMDMLSTYYGEKLYKMNDNGTFTSEDEYFMVPPYARENMVLKTVKDVKVDCVNEEGEVIEEDFEVPAGTDIYLYRTDGVTDEKKDAVIDCRMGNNDDGAKIIRFHRSNDYPHMVNGIDEAELFEMLYYAG